MKMERLQGFLRRKNVRRICEEFLPLRIVKTLEKSTYLIYLYF